MNRAIHGCAWLDADDAGNGYGYQKGQYATIAMRRNDTTHTLLLAARQGLFSLVEPTPGVEQP
ncbi:DUF5110 domain-containing protein [Rhodanobacter caeni]|uniref:DUF5110 domain-containing protein n=1 Tax=Rhodanobacter caeni TaxID=657654 RepID=A0ABN0UXG9_9GAMM